MRAYPWEPIFLILEGECHGKQEEEGRKKGCCVQDYRI